MAKMIDAISVDRDTIYKGAARLVYANTTLASFPGRFESVMNATTYALVSGWNDFGATTEEGITVSRSAELSDGIALDQRVTPLDEGEPESWEMSLETTLLNTSLTNVALAWEAGTLRAYIADGGYAAQHVLDLDAPTSFTQRMLCVIQEDPKSERLRMVCFRKVTPKVDGSDLTMSRGEASELPVSFTLAADEDVAQGSGQFGRIYELD